MDKANQATLNTATAASTRFQHKTRILHCIRQGQVGGGESHVIDLVKNLNMTKYENIVLAFTDGEMISLLRAQGVNCHVIPTTRPFDVSVWGSVKTLISGLKIDLIHIHGTRAFSNVLYAGRLLKKPIIYTVHGWSFNEFQTSLRKKIAIFIEGIFTKLANTTINVSYANQTIGKEAIRNFKSVVIPNGIDVSKFSTTGHATSIRQELKITDNKTLIGFIARMTEQKDPFTLLYAFDALHKKSPNKFNLLFVGDGELKESLMARTKELNLTDVVFFEKFRKDIPAILQQVDIFCLPSLWEGLSLGLLEAMSMGKAIVATTVDGTREVVKHNENGLLFKPKNIEELATNLHLLSEDTELKQKLENNARATVSQYYSLEMMIQKTEEVYLNVITE